MDTMSECAWYGFQLTIPKKMAAVHLTIMLCHLKSAQITVKHDLSC